MSTDEATEKICKALEDLATAIRSNANSPLRASSEQSVVARPERFESENPALAQPVTLSKVRLKIGYILDTARINCVSEVYREQFRDYCKEIFKWLDTIDQGPLSN